MIRKLLILLSLSFFAPILAQPLSGVYTVGGTSPDYATVVTAVAALETNGVSGPVTFNIRSGTYASQSFTLTEITGQSPTNTVTFQSETANASDVTFTSSTFTFTQGSQYVTVKNIGLSGGTRKIYINGNTYVGHFNILNCIFTNTLTLSVDSLNNINVANAVTQIAVINGYDIVIDGNTFNNAGVCINKSGSLTDNFTFSNNIINGGIMPISIYQGRDVTISGNEYSGNILRNIMSVTNSDDNLIISGNRFKANTTTTGLTLSTISGNYTVGTNLNLYNNFFSMAKELEVQGFYDTNIRFNSFSSSNSICLSITESSDLNAYNIYNNIFKNPYDKASIRAHMPATLTKLHMNYNAFRNHSLVIHRYYSGEGIESFYNFSDWKVLSGEDMNSKISGNVFGSEPDLHAPNSIVINGAGTPISGILTDIDGQPRNAVNPDIGADEFDMDPATFRDLGITLVTPASICDVSALQVLVTNNSPFELTGFDIECVINSNRGNFNHYTNTLAPGESVSIAVTGCAITPNTWYEELEVNVANPSGGIDNNFSNDRIILEDLFQLGPFEIGIESNDCNTATKLYIPQFYGMTQVWSTGAVTPLITVQNPGTYSVTITDIGGCTITKSITVN
ncbi:hypothetical protein [Flavobacterium sp. 102]|uniref:hypothetical protein n=1 Tax=Flavobacterium sp. 102 TaxID=2135623 RepID=UPI000EB0F6A8|nr:hypothetical protein [Flavobacterium sp. 102]RKS03111.1 hypothetical protein C8C84_2852 [Flavobacterium sp. 102]